MKTKLIEMIKSKFLLWFAIIGSIIPIIIISFYNRQSADDFTYTLTTHKAVEEGTSLLAAAIETTKYFMDNWNGLYFSSFLQSLSSGIFGSQYCFINTLVILIMLVVGVEVLSWTVIRRVFHNPIVDWKLLGAIIILYILQTMPSPVQGLYWYNGAVNYMFMWALFLVLLSTMLIYVLDESCKNRKVVYILGLLLMILTVGGNHVVQGLTLGFSLLITMYSVIKKKRRVISLYFIISCVGFLINMTSGGSEVRWETMPFDHSIPKSTIISLGTTLKYGVQWSTISSLFFIFAAGVILFPLFQHYANQHKTLSRVQVAGILSLSVLIIFCMNFIPTYAMGYAGAGRVTDIIYATFAILSIIDVMVLFYVFYEKLSKEKDRYSETKEQNSVFKAIILLSAVCYISIFGMGTCIRMPYGSTAVNAVKDLVSGEAKIYATEFDARETFYKEHQGENVTVEELSCYPYTIYFADLDIDTMNYKNIMTSEYYGLKSIVCVPKEN